MSLDKDGIPKWMKEGGDKISVIVDSEKEEFENRKANTISGGTKRTTRGVLFWNRPYVITQSNGEKMCILVMDTQGLWDPKTSNEFNCSIFGLSCLLSSYVIFNQKNNINTEQLSKFSVLSEFSKRVVSEDGVKPFQHLDFLLRDYEGYDVDSDVDAGIECSRERLQEMREGKVEGEMVKKIEECFDEYGLLCFPHPGKFVAAKKYDGTISKAEPLYMQVLSYYIDQVIGRIKPRKIGGTVLIGKHFTELVLMVSTEN